MTTLGPQIHSSKLENAWLLRWNQKIDDSMSLLLDIQSDYGWKDLSVNNLSSINTKKEKEDFVEALLLKGSFYRAQGQRRKSSSWIKKIVDENDRVLFSRGFRILFELGIDHWVNEDLAEAMECFILAEKKARNSIEKIYSTSNLLWCLEAMDLERAKIEIKLEILLEEQSSQTFIHHVCEQWTAYKLRKDYYLKLSIPKNTDALTGQAQFLVSWINLLPYANSNWSKKLDELLLTENEPYIWQGAYRQRTLNGIWLPADLEVGRVADAVDRLYLWTWWWLTGHEKINTEKIIWTLESILDILEIESTTKDTLFLLRNSIAWITLIEPGLKTRVGKVINSLMRLNSSNFQVLEIEFLLTQTLLQADPSDLVKRLKIFPVFHRLYNELINSNKSSTLKRVKNRILPFLTMKEGESFKLVIDVSKNEIRAFNEYHVLKSKYLSKLLSLLSTQGYAKFNQIIVDQEEIDTRQIYNLVVRARKLTSTNAIKVRGDEVLRGNEWPQVLLLNYNEDSDALDFENKRDNNLYSKSSSLVDSQSYLQAGRALLLDGFNRKDIETNLKVSKATACRMLDKWIQDGLIEITGKAKSTKYFWIKNGSNE